MTQIHNLGFVFPGQGSQSVGMVARLAAAYPVVQQTFAEAGDALGMNLWELVENGPAETLNQTSNTQPALLAAAVATWRVWCARSDLRPAWMAGHSLGEYSALVCANAIGFADAIKLVAERGRLMQEAVPAGVGAMAAILGLDDATIVKACAEAAQGQIVAAANFNAPGQVVIAGETAAVERAMSALNDLGAKRTLKLAVSVPSHCSLMSAAAERLAEVLQNTAISTPDTAIVHNTDVCSHADPAEIRAALAAQLYQSVRWVDSIRHMQQQGVTRFVECGPGKVLLGLNKRIAGDAGHFSVFDPESLTSVMEQLHG